MIIGFENRKIFTTCFALSLLALIASPSAEGGSSCCSVGDNSGWSGADFLNDMGPAQVIPDGFTATEGSEDGSLSSSETTKPRSLEGSDEILSSATEVMLNVDAEPQRFIPGSVQIAYKNFVDGSGRPRSVSEISQTLGNAGISRYDLVTIYGEDPYRTTFVFLILDYLGQERVDLLDGGIDDWMAAGKPIEEAPIPKDPTSYLPDPRDDLVTSYDYLRTPDLQVVDARPVEEYDVGSMTGSENIPYEAILDGGRIKDGDELAELFAGLEKTESVVVYSNDAVHASAVWYALKREGYDVRLYAGEDWLANLIEGEPIEAQQSSFAEVTATPSSPPGYEQFLPPCCR
jgi:3-mercaptopyruvate sulfurtransferase SseA